MNRREKTKIILLLLFLSAGIPELLTGSTPYWRFINPFNLTVLLTVYGLPAIIYRELRNQWNLEYWELMILGLIQGVYIEGILVNTYYDPRYTSMGVFASYGRVLGINFPWAFYITFFHSIFSVTVPIMLVDSFFPGKKREQIFVLNGKTASLAIIVLLVMAFLFSMDKTTYSPPIGYHIMSVAVIFFLLVLVKKGVHGKTMPKIPVYPERRPLLLLYPPMLVIVAFYGLQKIAPPIIHVIVGILLYISLINNVRRTGQDAWNKATLLLYGQIINALIAGTLGGQKHTLVPAIIIGLLIPVLKQRIEKQ